MKIAIIGAGWYGCHIATTLINQNAKVTVYEKNEDIFLEASSNNQFRLHQGLHYARSSKTRHQSRDGFFRFLERYPNFSKPVNNNFYLVPNLYSLIDFDTYFSIMFSSGIHIERVPLESIDFINKDMFQGAIKCSERIILNSKAKSYFKESLKSVLRLNTNIQSVVNTGNNIKILNEDFDFIIDTTWGSISNSFLKFFYEPTLLLYYTSTIHFPAVTLVDGPLLSIYPTEISNQYSLSSVTHTPLGRFNLKSDAYNFLKNLSPIEIMNKRLLMEKEVKAFFPDFDNYFSYKSPQLSIKTKPIGLEDNRNMSVSRNENFFVVNSGKIDNIFQASDFILGQIFSND
jgi:hypothetical protein